MFTFIILGTCYNKIKAQNVIIENRIFNPDKDNKIYKRNKNFRFSYTYEFNDKNSKLLLSLSDGSFKWSDSDTLLNNNSIFLKEIDMQVIKPKLFSRTNRFQSELLINYIFDKQEFSLKEWTGLVENNKNIWLHPPRANLFETLELSPFPFVKYPLKIGKVWTNILIINKSWYQKLNFSGNWEKSIPHKSIYEIKSREYLIINGKNLVCWVINAKAKSSIGVTNSVFYFNEIYGFVKIVHSNYDGSKITFKLIELPD